MSPRFAVIQPWAPDLARGVRRSRWWCRSTWLRSSISLRWRGSRSAGGSARSPTGTRRARALSMALSMAVFVVASTGVIWVAGMLASEPVAEVLFIALVGFVTSFARAINGPAGTIGNLVVLIAAIAGAGTGLPLQAAGLFAGGALWGGRAVIDRVARLAASQAWARLDSLVRRLQPLGE